ncbi:hypothetical protein MASR1M45_24040 [Candidatus Kapaibacterium sp.]
MKLIRELEDVPAEGRTIEFIQFSENAKYVGYGHKSAGKSKATFFSCELPYKKVEFLREKLSPNGMQSLGFIQENFIYLSCMGYPSGNYSIIYDINNDKIIYETDLYHSYFPVFNQKYNNIVINGALALNFNKILNSVSINEPNDLIQKFITEYRKGILKISGIESISPIINLTISDIKGNIVFQNGKNHIKDIIEIPVQLQNGVYLLHIQDVNKSHTAKFLVVE